MRILIIEDEYVSQKKMERLIQNLGYETLVASDGIQGLETWKKQRPRIVLTDWEMPETNGVEVCKTIRKLEGAQYTYLILVTAKTDIDDIIEGMDAGADAFITKPFIKEELGARIRAGERIINFETRDIVIFSLAKLAESRDPETGNHLERIRFYSKALAQQLSLTSYFSNQIDNLFIDNIFLTSPLHDIGKIGIPDFILLKPGRFDQREFEIMKEHSIIGFNTLNEALQRYPRADYLKMSAEIALSHHEKFDGTGYPHGLKGSDIPLAARIVAIADVYDALVSKRVYKNAYVHDMAKSIILKDSGSHFDPQIVEGFIECQAKFVDILERFKETD